jgi:DNA polymerase III epsilon subunit-like protein
MAIDKILSFDCETTGFEFGLNPSINHQMISAGLVVATSKFEIIEELYVEIQWDGKSQWAKRAEEIHGLSKEHLAKYGKTKAEAAEAIGGLLMEHWGMEKPINLLGTNVMSFDIHFLDGFLQEQEIPFRFSHRAFDTFSLAMGTVRAETSDSLFKLLGFGDRGKHNALEDAKLSLAAFREIYTQWVEMEEICQQVLA